MPSYIVALCCAAWLSLCTGQNNNEYKLVNVHGQGAVRGTVESRGTLGMGQVISFRGIPYAKSLNQTNRFKPPEEAESFRHSPFLATESRPCPQMSPFEDNHVIGEEDCLTLDVHTKLVPDQNQQSQKSYPVVVYFPGGRFRYGSSATFGPKNLMDTEMVLVVVNYRLGALGFLSTEDSSSPGNYGLMDQQMALRWIKRNVAQFNGDSTRITLFGHDSGAASISLHTLVSKSYMEFNQAALSGGSFLNPWAFHHKGASRHAHHLADRMGCGSRNNRALVECLRHKSAQDIVKETNNYKNITFLPVADKNFTSEPFLDDDPIRLLKERRGKSMPLLIGMTKDEGSIEFYENYRDLMTEQTPLAALNRYFRPYLFPQTLFDSYLPAWHKLKMESVCKGILFVYFKNVQAHDWSASKSNWIEALSDFLFRSGSEMFARLLNHQEKNSTYMYQFEYASPLSYGHLVRNSQSDPNGYGAAHMDDSFYYFNTTYDARLQSSIPSQEQSFITTFRTNFKNILFTFAKDGRLNNLQLGIVGGMWHPYGTNESVLRLHKLDTQGGYGQLRVEVEGRFRTHQVDFFSSFVPDMLLDNSSAIFYEDQETNEHFKASTWGLLGLVLVLLFMGVGLVAVFVVIRRRSGNDRKFQKLPSSAPSDGHEMRGV